jgi:hypothetical protein
VGSSVIGDVASRNQSRSRNPKPEIRRPATVLATWLCAATCAVGADPGPRISGEVIHANTVEYGPLVIRDVVAVPRLDGRALRFDPCTGRAYAGTLTGSVSSELDSGLWRISASLMQADLAAFLRQYRANAQNLSGQVALSVDLTIPLNAPATMSGRGELHISDATLIIVPFLANLLIGDPGAQRGRVRLDATFTIGDGRITIDQAVLQSPAATIGFSGSVGLDGELAIEITPDLRLKVLETVTANTLNRVLAPLGRRASKAILRGQVTNPELVMNPFGLNE